MNIDHYLERIHYHGGLAPNKINLMALHRAHMLAIPFENLDIHLKRPIRLTPAALFNKLVTERRGGFCFEQNGLFALVLRSLGYKVTLIEARVKRDDGTFGIPRNHLALMVELADRWLVDVGFGDSFLEPLRLDEASEQWQDGKAYRVVHNGAQGMFAARNNQGEWVDQYMFYLDPQQIEDFNDACHYMQTSPLTHFTQKRVCTLATPTGRLTLRDYQFAITHQGVREERTLASEAEFLQTLDTYFGIDLALARV